MAALACGVPGNRRLNRGDRAAAEFDHQDASDRAAAEFDHQDAESIPRRLEGPPTPMT
jgi:hypothetical protein